MPHVRWSANPRGEYWIDVNLGGHPLQGRPHLGFDELRVTAVVVPPLAEQAKIVREVEAHLSVVDRLAAQMESNLQRASRLRQSILKRAFEGKLVPQDPTDEPASTLLERIRSARETASKNARETTSNSVGNDKRRRRREIT